MKRFYWSVALFCPALVAAATKVEPPCVISEPSALLSCALKHHPDIIRAEAAVSAARATEHQARQVPNPDVTAESTSFRESDEPSLTLESAYLHTFELGGKRSARIAGSQAQAMRAHAELRRAQEAVAVQTMVQASRLRQVEQEKRLLQEAIETFDKVIRSYENRPRLSGEQEVSVSVFRLAGSDYRLRMASLDQEEAGLVKSLKVATALPTQVLNAALPPEMTSWPTLVSTMTLMDAGDVQSAKAALEMSQADQASAISQAWPDVKLGPRVNWISGRGQDALGLGGALSLALPLYQRNAGGKAAASASAEAARIALETRERERQADVEKWHTVYESAVQAHRSAPQIAAVQAKHVNVERFFERGLVSASLVIEAHRQMTDLVRSRHEQELHAIEALWSIYALEGRNLEVIP
jgi:cobalt-zinc-cadmium efflux system outer membrane protein